MGSLTPDNQQLSTINTTINTTIKMVAGDMRGSLEEILLDNKAIRDLSLDELNAIFQERALGEQRISEIKERRRKLKNRYYFLYFQGKVRLIRKYFFTWLEKIFIPQTFCN